MIEYCLVPSWTAFIDVAYARKKTFNQRSIQCYSESLCLQEVYPYTWSMKEMPLSWLCHLGLGKIVRGLCKGLSGKLSICLIHFCTVVKGAKWVWEHKHSVAWKTKLIDCYLLCVSKVCMTNDESFPSSLYSFQGSIWWSMGPARTEQRVENVNKVTEKK